MGSDQDPRELSTLSLRLYVLIHAAWPHDSFLVNESLVVHNNTHSQE